MKHLDINSRLIRKLLKIGFNQSSKLQIIEVIEL